MAWSQQQYESAQARGEAGGELSSDERAHLKEDAKLPGERGKAATRALQNAK